MHAASDAMCDEVQDQGISFRDGIRERGPGASQASLVINTYGVVRSLC